MRWLVVVMVAACADRDGSGSGPYARLDQLPQLLHEAMCTRFVRCGTFPDRAACDATIGSGTGDLYLGPGLVNERNAGHLAYDGARGQACLDRIADASCSPNAAPLFDSVRDCFQRAITPALADGETCEHDWSCTSGACEGCDWAESCCTGTCGPPSYPRPVIDVPIGGSCGTYGSCALGLMCDYTGTCREPIAAGDVCVGATDQPNEYYSLRCADELTCNFASKTCQPTPGLGERCDDIQCNSVALICNSSMTCVPMAVVGDACVTSSDCPWWLACTAGTCTANGAGEPCPCADGATFCGGDPQHPVCVPYRANGAACNQGLECESGVCDSGSCSRC
ncbi:MAG: hypothetical protein QM831_00980 [Kofleriaceae bacterium]